MRRIVRSGKTFRVDGFAVEAGTPVLAVLPLANLDCNVYGPDAEVFNPARWAQEPAPPLPLTYGGEGSHACIGKHLVRVLVRALVRDLLLFHDTALLDKAAEAAAADTSNDKWLPVSRPRVPVLVTCTPRPGSEARVRLSAV